ncbi:hypothetical protein [Trueperella pyogenes]|uniref:hypothetical protein n=1 Tax=Trueperella pyogenes TaxID=1661 RepID=UPI0006B23E7D|nr:hypothetical protein [Trueperella pyogenes]ALD74580.1 hypothetical protein AN946_10050 [Trueperella pyogenes]
MTSTRLTGAALSLMIEEKEYMADISSWKLGEEEKDQGTRTFGDQIGGGQSKLTVETIQSLAATSLHQVVWDNPGKTGVAFTLAPAGNKKATAEQPHYTGKLNFPKLRPEIGLEAGAEDATSSIEFIVTEIKKTSESNIEEL